MAKATTTKQVEKVIKKEIVVEKKEVKVDLTNGESDTNKQDDVLVGADELAELRKYKTIVEEAKEQVGSPGQGAPYKEDAPSGQVKINDYEYFSDFDKGSSIPAWALPRPTEVLESEVDRIKGMLKRKEIPNDEIPHAQADYEQRAKRLDQIKNSKPKLTGLQIDKLRKKRDNLANEITRSKFTRLEMEKGLVDAHDEATRMSEPCIDVDKEEARRMGIKTVNGKVSRSVAEAMWKMECSLLGDTPSNPDTEILRNDTGHSKRNMITVPIDIHDGKVVY